MRLTLSRRGLILVAIPLLFELLFIGALSYQLKTAQMETAKEAEAKVVVFQTNRLFKHIYDSSMGLFIYITTRADPAAKLYEKKVQAIHTSLDQLQELLKHDPGKLQKLQLVEAKINKLFTATDKVKSAIDEGGLGLSFVRTAANQAEFHGLLRELMTELDAFSEEARKTEEEAPIKLERRQQVLELLLLVGVVLSIVVAVIVSLVFSRSITGRLSVMSENAERFAQGKPLAAPIKGGDEIAGLDAVFHRMADSISENQRLKQQIMSMVSHDLRSPLGALRVFLGNLAADGYGELSQSGKDAVKRASRSTTDLIDMTGDLLELEKSETEAMKLRFELIDVQSLCEDAAECLEWTAAAREIEIVTPTTEVQCSGDAPRLMRVLVNLLGNAIRYSPPNAPVVISSEDAGDHIVIHVIDQGPGIAPEHHAMIFDRFKQLDVTERALEGSAGLGLVVCKMIVERHGGKIGLKSVPGSGCDFWFELPINS